MAKEDSSSPCAEKRPQISSFSGENSHQEPTDFPGTALSLGTGKESVNRGYMPSHYTSLARQSLTQAVLRALEERISVSDAEEWIKAGCVFVNKERRWETGFAVEAGDYVRVNGPPRYFPFADAHDWRELFVAKGARVALVHKPAGVPMHSSLSNGFQNVVERIKPILFPQGIQVPDFRKLGVEAGLIHPNVLNKPAHVPFVPGRRLLQHFPMPGLHPANRLDVSTEGLAAICMDQQAASWLQTAFSKRDVGKTYDCLALGSVPTGSYVHYMQPSNFAPRRLAMEPLQENYQRCELVVEEVKSVAWEKLSKRAQQSIFRQSLLCPDSPHFKEIQAARVSESREDEASFYSAAASMAFSYCKIRLLTGRTHQIRCQLAALGNPLAGCVEYCLRNPLMDSSDAADNEMSGYPFHIREQISKMEADGCIALRSLSCAMPVNPKFTSDFSLHGTYSSNGRATMAEVYAEESMHQTKLKETETSQSEQQVPSDTHSAGPQDKVPSQIVVTLTETPWWLTC